MTPETAEARNNLFRSMSAAEIIRESARIFASHFPLMIVISLVPHLALLGLETLFNAASLGQGALLIFLLVTLVVNAFTHSAITAAVTLIAVGRSPGFTQVYQIAWQENFFGVVVGYLLSALVVFLGLLVLIVPGVVFGGLLAPLIPIILLEGKPAHVALSRSFDLVRGDLMRGIAVFLYFLLVSGLLPLTVLMIQVNQGYGALSPLLGTIVAAVTLPLAYSANVVLYFSTAGEQGLTVEKLLASLTGAQTPDEQLPN